NREATSLDSRRASFLKRAPLVVEAIAENWSARDRWKRGGFQLPAAGMDRTNTPASDRQSARLAPTPALSQAHPEPVASVPASFVRCLGHFVMQPQPGHSPIFFHRGGR